jgi:hypothetical protein
LIAETGLKNIKSIDVKRFTRVITIILGANGTPPAKNGIAQVRKGIGDVVASDYKVI